MPFEMDLVIALRVDAAQQTGRLLADGLSQDQIDARLRNQQRLEAKFHQADAIVDANPSQAVVFAEIDRLIDTILKD